MLKELIKEMLKEELSPSTVDANMVGPSMVASPTSRKSIVILQRGWVIVGDLHQGEIESRVENARVIRRWGTTKGLGELALNGPLESTKLDACGTVRFNNGAEVCRIDCSDKWN